MYTIKLYFENLKIFKKKIFINFQKYNIISKKI